MGSNDIPSCLKGRSFDEIARLSLFKSTNNKTLIVNVYLSKLILLYLFKDYWGSVKVAKLAEECQESISGQVNIAQYNFYYSLALLAHYPATIQTEQKQYLKKVASHQI